MPDFIDDIQFVLDIIKRIQDGDKRWTVDAKFSGASAIIVRVKFITEKMEVTEDA